jgi:anti-sigma B factor antagonist
MVVREDSAGQQISLSGKVDVTTVADLRSVLHNAIDVGDGELRIDVSTLELVDAAGLGVLLGAHRRAQRAGRTLVLVGVPDDLSRLLFKTRLYRVLNVDHGEPSVVIQLPDARGNTLTRPVPAPRTSMALPH